MTRHTTTTALLALALSATAAVPARAQSIADRVARVQNGTVRLAFALRPDVCGRGNSISAGPRSRMSWGDASDARRTRDVEWDGDCDAGPGRLVLDVRDREVTGLRFYVGGRWRPAGDDVTDLGTVPARAAADYLTHLAERGDGRPAREAIFPATLVDSAVVWPALLRIARSDTRPRDTRQQAVFWLGQAAGDAATAELSGLVSDDDVDREVRKQAVFALSQRPREEGIPALVRVARTHRDGEIRKQALFWLGQSGDPRAVALFEEILARR
jgi:hypothetical protein